MCSIYESKDFYTIIDDINELEFDIVTNMISKPNITLGMIFHNSYIILNEFMYKVITVGSNVFLHKNPNLLKLLNNSDFNEIKSAIEKKSNLKKYINCPDDFLNGVTGKWYFKDFSNPEFFRSKIEDKKINISTMKDNITYIYANDLIKTNIITLFKELNGNNCCIKMLTMYSSVSFDVLKIIKYIFKEVYIFKPKNDTPIKDTWYIIGTKCNTERLKEVNSRLSSIKTLDIKLRSLLKFDGCSNLANVYSNLTLNVTKGVNEALNSFIQKN